MKKIYYAHHMGIYNTEQEKRDIYTLKMLGLEVVNPNTKEYQEASIDSCGMDYWIRLVATCDALAFRAFMSGEISSGITAEMGAAIAFGLPVIELPSRVCMRVLSISDTVELLKEVGQR